MKIGKIENMNILIIVLALAFGLFMAFAAAYAEKNPRKIDQWIKKLDGLSERHKSKARELRK